MMGIDETAYAEGVAAMRDREIKPLFPVSWVVLTQGEY